MRESKDCAESLPYLIWVKESRTLLVDLLYNSSFLLPFSSTSGSRNKLEKKHKQRKSLGMQARYECWSYVPTTRLYWRGVGRGAAEDISYLIMYFDSSGFTANDDGKLNILRSSSNGTCLSLD